MSLTTNAEFTPRSLADDLVNLMYLVNEAGLEKAIFAFSKLTKVTQLASAQTILLDHGLDHVDESLVHDALFALLRLHEVKREERLETQAFLKELDRYVRTLEPSMADEKWSSWNACAIFLREVLSEEHVLAVFEKTMRFQYDYNHLFMDSNILTDIRPIFNESQKKPKLQRLLINHNLIINYQEGNNNKTIHLAMNINDLATLAEQVNRAIRKQQSILGTFKPLESQNIETIPVGDYILQENDPKGLDGNGEEE